MKFHAVQKAEPFAHIVNIYGGDRGSVFINLGTPACAAAFVAQLDSQTHDESHACCRHCGSDAGEGPCTTCLLREALACANLPPEAARYVLDAITASGFALRPDFTAAGVSSDR